MPTKWKIERAHEFDAWVIKGYDVDQKRWQIYTRLSTLEEVSAWMSSRGMAP
jgi:hypothetical protein